MGEPIEISDRYSATGIPRPDPGTVCLGDCEGMGCVPVFVRIGKAPDGSAALITESETDPELVRRWQEAEAKKPSDDGWHFVVCPACEGTRVRPGVPWSGPIIGADRETGEAMIVQR
jgi:hypothetical protein